MAEQLFYRSEGKGEPIVLLHGFLASSQYFKRVRDQLKSTHRVISIDLLGFGRSPKPRSSYTYEDHVEALHSTLGHIGLQRFHLVGHSLGALIALRYSRTYPNQVINLTLFNPPMYKSAAEAYEILSTTGLHYRIMLHSPVRDLLWYTAKLTPRFPFNKHRPAVNLTDVLRAGSAARKGSYQNIILNGAFFSDISTVTVHTLLVASKHDRPVYMRNLAAWSPPNHVRIEVIDNGHHLPSRDPELAATLLRS